MAHTMNLRSYKPTSKFNGEEPWQYPVMKSFSPSDQYVKEKAGIDAKLALNISNWYINPSKTRIGSPLKRKS